MWPFSKKEVEEVYDPKQGKYVPKKAPAKSGMNLKDAKTTLKEKKKSRKAIMDELSKDM